MNEPQAAPPTPVAGSGEPALSPLKRAFLALEAAQSRVAALEAAAREPIAVIGLGCRVPGGVTDAQSFWSLMRDGVDAIGPVPADRWDTEALYDPDPETPGRIATRAGGFIGPVDGFDAGLFGIAPREAQGMDPQQRLLLEVSWEALEHAGQAPDRLEGSRTGVYVGMCSSDYAYMQLMSGDRSLLDAHFTSGIAHSIGSGRLSYLLGLQGPSLTLDTACSSSLVAVHLACQALRAGDCRMALAGGVNLILSPDLYIALSHARMLAPDGRCKTFDAAADGFARGEGCGMVVLKRLSDAQADGDRVLAVIRGSAVNQDGPSSGLTAPNGPAQEAVIREALARAGVPPHEVGLIEAHGTGTQLGDPLEVQALGHVFGAQREQPLWLGSVKTNVGHLEAAAGVTGLIKLVLALQHRQIPAHLHFQTPSPHIPWDEFALRVPTALTPWEPINGRRVAGVSSFGFSGTNAHVVVEEAPAASAPVAVPDRAGRQFPFVLSARDEAALAALAGRCAAALDGRADEQLVDACFSAAVGRAALPQRAVVLARSMSELVHGLQALAEGREAPNLRCARLGRRDPARIAFLFTGQGAQYAGMGRALYEREPVFRAALDECATVLDPLLERPLLEVMFSAADGAPLLDQTAYTQPALFALEIALARLWRHWGVSPDAVMGHSVGELAAACVAGVMSLPQALGLIAARGRLMQSLPAGGAMAAVAAPEAEVAAALAGRADRIAIAAVNAPAQTVVAGTAAEVQSVTDAFAARGVRCQSLPVSHAFHSPLVDPMLQAFEQAAGGVSFARPQLRLVSNLSGAWADPAEVVRPAYWRRHVREAVRFADGLRTLASLRPDVCLEIGPHPTLLGFTEATLGDEGPSRVPSLRKGRHDLDQLAEALGALFLAGAPLDWRAVWSATGARPMDLPSYPFQRERQWFRAEPSPVRAAGRDTAHPLLGQRLRSAQREVVTFERSLRARDVPFLADHQVQGRAILPATGFIEMALAAAQDVWGSARALQDVAIVEPLAFAGDEARTVQLLLRRGDADVASFEVLSQADGEDENTWVSHVQGRYDTLSASEAPLPDGLDAVRARCEQILSGESHRAALRERALDFGPSLHGVREILRRDGEALGDIELPRAAGQGAYQVHPALLDACLQVMAAALPSGTGAGRAYLPMAIERVVLHRSPGGRVTSHVRVDDGSGAGGLLRASVGLQDERGPVARIDGIALRPVSAPDAPLYHVEWPRAPDAAWLPAPAALAAQAGPLLDGLAREHGLDDYHQAFLALESLSADWVVRAFTQMGWHPASGDRVDAAALAQRLGLATRYRRLLPRLLAILAEDGLLRAEGAGWAVQRWSVPEDPAPRVSALLQRHPASRPRIQLTAACGEVLGEILRGTVDPLHRLFPEGSADLAEALYRDAPEAKAYNQLVRETVHAALRQRPQGTRLRVLEVGGGTGGTTAWLAPALPAAGCDYLFTDVGPSMVARAKEKFAAHGFMRFQTLDLEQDLAGQGLGEQRFDIVIASNVVHATADLRRTLARLRGALAPGGTLLMLEVAGDERWIDITFGLTEGWWLFTDTDLRPSQPLLSRERWLRLLAEQGFEAAAIDAPDARSREVLLAARKPVDAVGVADAWPAPGHWLLLADAQGVADSLAQGLRAAGQRATLLPADAAHGALRQGIADAGPDLHGIVHLGSLDLIAPGAPGTVVDSLRAGPGSLLALVQAMGAMSFSRAPRLWVATRGAQAVHPLDSAQPEQATAWGLLKAIALEHPEWRASGVDLDAAATADAQAADLLRELGLADAQDQVAWRAGVRHTARLAPHVLGPGDAPVRLEKAGSGVLDDIALRAAARRAPGPGEVEISVRAAGLNFRDIMNAVAMRDDPEPLGGECAGRVVRVGEGVSGIAVGDAVVATGEACFASHVTTEARHVAPMPGGISFAQAATLPFAFMTAYHALHVLGGLRPGMSVLVHAGAGGVGMAAIQLARRAGAVVHATAGSEAKRATLRALGVEHVMDSRSLAFADEILRATQGRGVDLVLNSLAGDFIAASVRCLADDGTFLEIGKRDIWSPERFALERPRAAYHAIDLNAQRYQDPAAAQALFAEVMGLVNSGEIAPLPLHAFPLERGAEAFRFMAQARHTGKVVLTRHDAALAGLDALSPQGTYLITGGLSGLGLISAMRLVEQGARHLVLAGRRAPSEAALVQLDAMRALGAQIKVVQADVSRADEVARVLGLIGDAHPLRGLIHSAGVLEDGALQQQDWARFTRPLGPKVEGTWALHALTQHLPLDFFVLYSSVAALLGSSGQGNHAAANAFMDALALQRRAMGLPALSIAWGAWSEVGAAAEREVDQRVGSRGIDTIAPRAGLDILQALMAGEAAHVGVFPVRWERFLEAGVPPLLERFRSVARGTAHRSAGSAAAPARNRSLAEELQGTSPAQREERLLAFVAEHVARVIDLRDPQAIDPRQPLNEMGLDSLMAVDLRNRLGKDMGLARSLPATLVFDYPTLEALAGYIDQIIAPAEPATGEPPVAPKAGGGGDAAGAIDDLSDEEIEALFAKKLQKK